MVYRILIRLCDIDMLTVMADRIITAAVECGVRTSLPRSKNRRYLSSSIVGFLRGFLLMIRVIDICLFAHFFSFGLFTHFKGV